MIVIVPHHNEPVAVLDATVHSALALDCCEGVVVVDDASIAPPDLELWDAELRFAYLALTENRGPAGAINAGIRHLEHVIPGDPLIARLDCGDVLTEERELQVYLMLERGDVPATFSLYFDPTKGKVIAPHRPWANGVYTDNMFAASTTVFRRSVWEQVGGYDESLRWCDDWDFAMKVQKAVGWRRCDEVTAHAAQFPGGHSDVSGERAALRNVERKLVHRRGLQLKRAA